MFALRITGYLADFEQDQLLAVFDRDEEPDDDDWVMRSEADFDIHYLAAELDAWRKGGRTEEAFRELLAEQWPLYAQAKFPSMHRWWLPRGEAEVYVNEDVAEWIDWDEAAAELLAGAGSD